MPNGGWIKLFRKIQEWEHYLSEPFDKTHAWIDLILLANHEKKYLSVRGNMIEINRGELAWAEDTLAKRWRWSRWKVRTFLEWLKTRQQIEQQKSHILSKIIILQYEKYQSDCTTDHTTESQQTIQQKDTNKNVKNYKNEKKERRDFVPPSLQEVTEYCRERGNGIEPNRFLDFYASKGWLVGKSKMKDWRAAVRTWEGRNGSGQETGFLDLNSIK